ncbi:MAG: alpha/beta hydrolase [Candidatus Dormibacteraeota bacterium]|nr:alpha/beta hydrolase [Candidatus Dormibacteraeota bacterium]
MARLLLAHGASGDATSMRAHVAGLRTRAIDATAVDLPRGRAERALPVYAGLLADVSAPAVIGGHSYGGRVASMLAASDETGMVAGLMLLSYPLHRPGHPEEQRTEHWPQITCPVLLLSGASDPFAREELMRQAVHLLPDARLVMYQRVGHGLAPVLHDALDQVAAFMQRLDG